jgi:peptidoglycan/xylan/chitin deacetylase (PgdA/CDA1 family)
MPGKKVYLTFDDGPHPEATPAVLDVLRQHSIPATFFISGENIAGNEPLIRRIAAEGHSLGIHAYHHTRSLAFSASRTEEEIIKTRELLSVCTDRRIRLFRPPYGFFTSRTIRAARTLDCPIIMWSCLTGDFRNWSTEKIVGTALHRLNHGSILVFHDNHLTKMKIGTILQKTIEGITKQGFEFGAIR